VLLKIRRVEALPGAVIKDNQAVRRPMPVLV
jgi:hypothetical protein